MTKIRGYIYVRWRTTFVGASERKKNQLAPDSQKLTSRLKEAYNGSETNFDNHWLLYSYNFCPMLFFKLASLGIWTNNKIFRNRFVSKHLEPYLHMISTVKERLRCLKYFSLPLGWIDVRYSQEQTTSTSARCSNMLISFSWFCQ